MKVDVKHASSCHEYSTEERCFITEISNSDNDPDLSIALARVEPGVTTAWHSLIDTAERYLIVSGQGLAEVGDLAPQALATGDALLIPAGVKQRIKNTGNADLLFYALCTPRFLPENYVHLE